jgi:hypothetical protein
MSEVFLCGRTSEPCSRTQLCAVANAPLVGSVTQITQEVTGGPGKRPHYAGAALTIALGRVGETMLVDFAPNADDSDATICPGELIDRGLRDLSPEQIAQGAGFMAATAIRDVVFDLNLRQARR